MFHHSMIFPPFLGIQPRIANQEHKSLIMFYLVVTVIMINIDDKRLLQQQSMTIVPSNNDHC